MVQRRSIARYWQLYLFLVPAVLYIFLFKYFPMYGIQIAFRDYSPALGFAGSEWVGFEHFLRFFNSFNFSRLISNTLLLNLFQLVAFFPMPIIVALALNQMRSKRYKSVLQTVFYVPHFISLVVLVGMLHVFLSPSSGVINKIIELLGGEAIFFLGEPGWFRPVYIISGIWQETGWVSIIYLAALTGISPDLYEASVIDGANKWRQIRHIDLPGIMPVVVVLLILEVGKIMNLSFEKALLMQTELNKQTSDIISTYVYEMGLLRARHSFATAVGLFNSVVNFVLLAAANAFARRKSDIGIW